METIDKLGYEEVDYIALYSLEKLIEWKLHSHLEKHLPPIQLSTR